MADWLLDGATRDAQSVDAEWMPVDVLRIDGVVVQEVRHVATRAVVLTEMYRTDWHVDSRTVEQVFQSVFARDAISAWHAHEEAQDRLFVASGLLLIALFDPRPQSPTFGLVNEFLFGELRPALVCVPPKVWHGVANVGDGTSTLVNIVDRAYSYEAPDHWRLPLDSSAIPYDIVARARASRG